MTVTVDMIKVPVRSPITAAPRPWDPQRSLHVAGWESVPECMGYAGYGDGVAGSMCDRRVCHAADRCYEAMRNRVAEELSGEVAEFQEELERLLATMQGGDSDSNLAVKMLRKRWEDEGRTLPFEIAYRAHERVARLDRGWLPCRGAECGRAVQREDLLDALGRCPRCERENRQTVAAAEAQ